MAYCQNCGTNMASAFYCSNCGTKTPIYTQGQINEASKLRIKPPVPKQQGQGYGQLHTVQVVRLVQPQHHGVQIAGGYAQPQFAGYGHYHVPHVPHVAVVHQVQPSCGPLCRIRGCTNLSTYIPHAKVRMCDSCNKGLEVKGYVHPPIITCMVKGCSQTTNLRKVGYIILCNPHL